MSKELFPGELIFRVVITIITLIITIALFNNFLEEGGCLKGATQSISKGPQIQCQIVFGIIGIAIIVVLICYIYPWDMDNTMTEFSKEE